MPSQVRVRLFGPLRDAAGWSDRDCEGETVAAVWESICDAHPELRGHRRSVRPAVDLAYAEWDSRLRDGAELAFIPPVAGGAVDAVRQVSGRLTREPIDIGRLTGDLRTGADGATAVFLGTVRNHNHGLAITRLDYEAYEPMADVELQAIADELAAQHEVTSLVAVHRIGELAVGDVSVAVVATAVHRDAALRACGAAIEEIKRRVPIFKREHTSTGARWVDARCGAAEEMP